MLCDIKNLLRADHPEREPKFPAKAPSIDVNRPLQPSNLSARARKFENFSPVNSPVGILSIEVEHPPKLDASKATIHDAPKDSDSTATIRTVKLLSWEEIHCPKTGSIPPLIIRHNDVVGDRRLQYRRDGFMFYDISTDHLHFTISCRAVEILPNAPSEEFFTNHAVRVFLESPPVPDIKNGPFYKYLGDCYIMRTEKYLPKVDWAMAPKDLKDLFVSRFIKVNNKVDNYRTGNDFTPEYVHGLFNRGYIFPLVLLRQARQTGSDLSVELASHLLKESSDATSTPCFCLASPTHLGWTSGLGRRVSSSSIMSFLLSPFVEVFRYTLQPIAPFTWFGLGISTLDIVATVRLCLILRQIRESLYIKHVSTKGVTGVEQKSFVKSLTATLTVVYGGEAVIAPLLGFPPSFMASGVGPGLYAAIQALIDALPAVPDITAELELPLSIVDGFTRAYLLCNLIPPAVTTHASPSIATSPWTLLVSSLVIANAGFFFVNMFSLLAPTPFALTTPPELQSYGWTTADLWCAPVTTGLYALLTHAQPFWADIHSLLVELLGGTPGAKGVAALDPETARAVCAVVLSGLFLGRTMKNFGLWKPFDNAHTIKVEARKEEKAKKIQ
ncbi:hypothetical protein D9615_001971 [Tricholomella constricta]|uniref:Uncharacterized protein n=1 Tax=Tricholomella constricta TaxID=117010 RepID=A0A8H5M9W3_9AGAR|nr:hypothetical protein D9615_001971 [Tricholomella constricta]